jgi:hypothetical protein
MSFKLRTISLVALGAMVLALAGVAARFASGSNVRVVHVMTASPHIEALVLKRPARFIPPAAG